MEKGCRCHRVPGAVRPEPEDEKGEDRPDFCEGKGALPSEKEEKILCQGESVQKNGRKDILLRLEQCQARCYQKVRKTDEK